MHIRIQFGKIKLTFIAGADDSGATLILLRDKFVSLVNKQFLIRCPSPVESEDGKPSPVPNLSVAQTQLYLPPTLNIKVLVALQQGESGDAGDNGVYWRVNFDRFHQDFRYQYYMY